MVVSEIIVALTDYGLTLECALFAVMLLTINGGWEEIRGFFGIFFLSLAATSLTGGTYHLFFSASSSAPADVLWKTTVIALGAVAFAAWSIGACLLLVQSVKGLVVKAALVEFLGYSAYVVAIDDHFWVAIANYLPSVIFLGAAFTISYRRLSAPPILIGLLGLGVTVAAAAIQRFGLSLHPTYFNHNATYHLVQAIGLFMIFRAAIFFSRKPLQKAGS
ncbi:MAG TPA: hypothetical protein VK583_11105 [Burkholderiales bacterium]|nr:hypothetical protein [Burkholderiales bacterium]